MKIKKVIPSIILIVTVLGVILSVIEVTEVKGASMEPLIQEGQIVYSVITPSFKEGEIVIANTENQSVIKRIYAVSGDNIEITEQNVLVNGELVKVLESVVPDIKTTLGEGEYLLLGDNPGTSYIITDKVRSRVEVITDANDALFSIWR